MKANRNWLERAVFWASCVLVLLVMGYLAWDAWTVGDEPPDLAVTVGTPVRGAEHWRVPVTVENRGDATAEQVRVGVALRQADKVLEQTEFFLSYVPRRSKREGWVTFRHAPTLGELDARPLGYSVP